MVLGKKIRVLTGKLESGVFAEYHSDDKTIVVAENCPMDELEPSLLHELIHVVLDITGENELMTIEQEEKFARMFEQGLCDVLRFK
jgi:hypothetical protein